MFAGQAAPVNGQGRQDRQDRQDKPTVGHPVRPPPVAASGCPCIYKTTQGSDWPNPVGPGCLEALEVL